MSRRIKMVFFDVGGTLITPQPSVGEIYARVGHKYGILLDPNILEKRFKTEWKARNGLRDLTIKNEIEWWKSFVERVVRPGKKHAQFEDYFNDLYQTFEKQESWSVYPDVKKTLTQLRSRGIRLGIISNWDSRLPKLMKGLDLSYFFDTIVVSGLIGVAKPHPGIFQEALRQAKTRPEECLHVGDHPEEDFLAATNAGFSALLLARGTPPEIQGRSIRSLNETQRFISSSDKEY